MADLILVVHFALVLFVVLGQAFFMLGGWLRWRWTGVFWLRVSHLVLIGYIAGESWLGVACPLTLWEQQWREAAGQPAYRGSFVEHWVSRLMFFDAPGWIFVAAYTAFLALVALTWWLNPPRRASGVKS